MRCRRTAISVSEESEVLRGSRIKKRDSAEGI